MPYLGPDKMPYALHCVAKTNLHTEWNIYRYQTYGWHLKAISDPLVTPKKAGFVLLIDIFICEVLNKNSISYQ